MTQERAPVDGQRIDVHHHCIPKAYLDAVERDGTRLGAEVRRDGDGAMWLVRGSGVATRIVTAHWDMDTQMADLCRAGYTSAALSVLPVDTLDWAPRPVATAACRAINDAIAEMARRAGGCFHPMATLPLPFTAEAVGEMERCHRDLAFQAVQIPPFAAGENLDDPSLLPLWEAVSALGLLVFVHPVHYRADPPLGRYFLKNLIGNPLDTGIAAASLIFGGVLERFPTLRVCLAHAGGVTPGLAGRWRHGWRVRPEARGRLEQPFEASFQRLYFDSLSHSAEGLRFLVDLAGPEHVVLGTDYPADMGDVGQIQPVLDLPGLTEAQRRLILGDTARRLLNLLPAAGETP